MNKMFKKWLFDICMFFAFDVDNRSAAPKTKQVGGLAIFNIVDLDSESIFHNATIASSNMCVG